MRIRKGRLGVLLAIVIMIAIGSTAMAAEQVVLRFRQQSSHGGEWVEKVIADFEAANPGVTVVVEDGGSGYLDNLTVALLGGAAPDVFQGWGTAQRSWAANGFLLDINPYLEKLEPNAKDLFYPGQWDALELTDGPLAGLRFGVPMYANVVGPIVYNRDALAQVGLAEPDHDWTWQDLENYASRLVQRQDNEIQRYGFVMQVDHPGWIDAWMRSSGGELFMEADRDRFMGYTPEALQALTFLTDLVQRGVAPSAQSQIGGEVNGFLGERVALSQMYSVHVARNVRDATLFDWGVASSPVGPAGIGPAMTVVDAYSVNRATQHPELAVKFLLALKSAEASRNQLRERGVIPSTRYPEVFQDVAELAPGKNMIAYLHALNHAVADARVFYSQPTQTQELLKEVLRDTFRGNVPPQTAMETARLQLEAILGK